MISMSLHKNFPSGSSSTGNLFDLHGIWNGSSFQKDGYCEFPVNGCKWRVCAWVCVTHNAYQTMEHGASTSCLLFALCIFELALHMARFRRVLKKTVVGSFEGSVNCRISFASLVLILGFEVSMRMLPAMSMTVFG